jgi:hypothetical protein
MVYDDILNNLSALSEEQLLEINKRVIQNIEGIRARTRATLKATLKKGDKVTFEGRERGRNAARFQVEGTILRMKRKRADVVCSKGYKWDVAITQMTKLD